MCSWIASSFITMRDSSAAVQVSMPSCEFSHTARSILARSFSSSLMSVHAPLVEVAPVRADFALGADGHRDPRPVVLHRLLDPAPPRVAHLARRDGEVQLVVHGE